MVQTLPGIRLDVFGPKEGRCIPQMTMKALGSLGRKRFQQLYPGLLRRKLEMEPAEMTWYFNWLAEQCCVFVHCFLIALYWRLASSNPYSVAVHSAQSTIRIIHEWHKFEVPLYWMPELLLLCQIGRQCSTWGPASPYIFFSKIFTNPKFRHPHGRTIFRCALGISPFLSK